jgi:S-adenosylhomocysteine hydrolase
LATIESVIGEIDILITTKIGSMKKMEDDAFEGNTGHFDNEIEMVAPENFPGIKVGSIKPQVDRFVFPRGRGIIMFTSGRLCIYLQAAQGLQRLSLCLRLKLQVLIPMTQIKTATSLLREPAWR